MPSRRQPSAAAVAAAAAAAAVQTASASAPSPGQNQSTAQQPVGAAAIQGEHCFQSGNFDIFKVLRN